MFTSVNYSRKTLWAQSLASSTNNFPVLRVPVSRILTDSWSVHRLPTLLQVMPNNSPLGMELRPSVHWALTAKDVSAGCQKTELKECYSCCFFSSRMYSLCDIFYSVFSPTGNEGSRPFTMDHLASAADSLSYFLCNLQASHLAFLGLSFSIC